MQRIDAPEIDDKLVQRLAEQVARVSHQGINREHPLLGATLPDGARIQFCGPPATRQHWAMAIRRHRRLDLPLDAYDAGPLDRAARARPCPIRAAEPIAFLRAAIRGAARRSSSPAAPRPARPPSSTPCWARSRRRARGAGRGHARAQAARRQRRRPGRGQGRAGRGQGHRQRAAAVGAAPAPRPHRAGRAARRGERQLPARDQHRPPGQLLDHPRQLACAARSSSSR